MKIENSTLSEIRNNLDIVEVISNYLPLNSNGKIIDYPSVDIQQALMKSKLFVPDAIQWEYFGINVFYIILFLGLSLLIIKKRDL